MPVDGGWSTGDAAGDWTECSAECGGGTQTRACNNPAPVGTGADCSGDTSRMCNEAACPEFNDTPSLLVETTLKIEAATKPDAEKMKTAIARSVGVAPIYVTNVVIEEAR